MNKTAAEVLRYYLRTAGEAVFLPAAKTEWPVTWGAMPDDNLNDRMITVVDTGGAGDGRLMQGLTVFHMACSIQLRSKGVEAGMAKGRALKRRFDALRNLLVTVGEAGPDQEVIMLNAVHVMNPVTPIGQNERNRLQLFAMNVQTAFEEG